MEHTICAGSALFQLPRWAELPAINLYLDQVLSLLDRWLGPYLGAEDKRVMTKTMVNNYVKQRFIPAPENRKYGRVAVASLVVIAVLKPVFSMEEIARLIRLAMEADAEEAAYDRFCEMMEHAVRCAFTGRTVERHTSKEDPRQLLWNACNAFACQLYVRKTYLYEGGGKPQAAQAE